jgi:hypothetical protein
MGRAYSMMGKMINAYRILVRKSEGMIPLGRPRFRWEDNIRMDIKEMVWEVVNWINLAQNGEKWWALVNTVMNLQVPHKIRSSLSDC